MAGLYARVAGGAKGPQQNKTDRDRTPQSCGAGGAVVRRLRRWAGAGKSSILEAMTYALCGQATFTSAAKRRKRACR